MKYLLLAILAFVAYRIWKSLGRKQAPVERQEAERSPENMVACAYCGVNLPASDALHVAGKAYCNERHLTAAGGSTDA